MSLKQLRCSGCGGRAWKHPENGCMVAQTAQILQDRRGFGERKRTTLIADIDADFLWSLFGPAIDVIEERHFPQ